MTDISENLAQDAKYIITVYRASSPDAVLLRTVKSRYESEQELVASLSVKILEDRVEQVNFRHATENEVHVDIRFAGDDVEARLLVYGSGFVSEAQW